VDEKFWIGDGTTGNLEKGSISDFVHPRPCGDESFLVCNFDRGFGEITSLNGKVWFFAIFLFFLFIFFFSFILFQFSLNSFFQIISTEPYANINRQSIQPTWHPRLHTGVDIQYETKVAVLSFLF